MIDVLDIILKILACVSLIAITVVTIDPVSKSHWIFSSKIFIIGSIIIMWMSGLSLIFVDQYISNRDKEAVIEAQRNVLNKQDKIHDLEQNEENERHKKDSIRYIAKMNGIQDSTDIIHDIITDLHNLISTMNGVANMQEKEKMNANIYKLKTATENIHRLSHEFVATFSLLDLKKDSIGETKEIIEYLTKSKYFLDSQIDNPFLAKNIKLHDELLVCMRNINDCLGKENVQMQNYYEIAMPNVLFAKRNYSFWDNLTSKDFRKSDSELIGFSLKAHNYCLETLYPKEIKNIHSSPQSRFYWYDKDK